MVQVSHDGAGYLRRGTHTAARRDFVRAFLKWLDEDTHAEWVDGEVIPKIRMSVHHSGTVVPL